MTHRLVCAGVSLLLDAVVFVIAYLVVLLVRGADAFASYFQGGVLGVDWSLPLMLGVTLLCFFAFGLYEREVFVFRPLLLRTLFKATLVATVISAAAVYLVKSPYVSQSRFVVLGTFFLFLALDAFVRIGGFARLYGRWVNRERPVVLLVGHSARSEVLARRLADLKGFTRWRRSECPATWPDGEAGVGFPAAGSADAGAAFPGGAESGVALPAARAADAGVAFPAASGKGASSSDMPDCLRCPCDCPAELTATLDRLREEGRPVTGIFIDADGLPLHDVLPAVDAARDRRYGTVYVMSDLLRPVHSNRVLFQLFEAPVVKVRAKPPNGMARTTKRAFDIAASAAALLVLAVPMAVIALAVKLSSPGPVLYRQHRIGARGRRFEFLKFRSMVVGDHHDVHREYVQALISGDVDACDQSDGEERVAELKMADDPRITRVGRFLRRYSLDELPQFWNVLRGDMSLVGPRPPLPYEVEAYDEWHRQRLQAVPGVSGVWQVGGRSRVSFDQMVFQDVFYAQNQSPLLDILICCRTVPAVINGRGGG